MKQAKASEEDLLRLQILCESLELALENGTVRADVGDGHESETPVTDELLLEIIRDLWRNGVGSGWRRVVFGYRVMFENACDPNEPTLEWKPELKALMEAQQELLAAKEDKYAHPSISEVMEAVPGLHWRCCWNCKNVALHADCVTPQVLCRKCGSQDTRKMQQPTARLKIQEGKTNG